MGRSGRYVRLGLFVSLTIAQNPTVIMMRFSQLHPCKETTRTNHFHVLEVVLLVEEVFQLHLQQAGLIDTIFSDNNKEKLFC